MFYVFSYGSNLLMERIQRRVFSVEKVKNHVLEDFELVFNKSSIDGSTKANVRACPGKSVLGVIHQMPWEHKEVLDEYEALGYGYEYGYLNFEGPMGQQEAHFYIAHEGKYLMEGAPYQWYLDYVIYGAVENAFDSAYIDALRAIAAKEDSNETRKSFNDQVLAKYREDQVL